MDTWGQMEHVIDGLQSSSHGLLSCWEMVTAGRQKEGLVKSMDMALCKCRGQDGARGSSDVEASGVRS